MGKHHKKLIQEEEVHEWPFKISINLSRIKPRIAFLSGCPREYYPEDCGYSKFGIIYGPADPEGARCQYTPSSDLLQKPISHLGYSIGGLSAPRFAKDYHSQTPAPNVYQSQIVPERVKKSEKVKKQSWSEFVSMYERICEEQFEKEERDKKERKEAQVLAAKERKRTLGTDASAVKSQKHLTSYKSERALARQSGKERGCRTFAFGMSLHRDRFERTKYNETAGVGTYDTQNTMNKKESFHITTPDGTLVPRVRMVCLPGSNDICMSCGSDLLLVDYYQTKDKRKVLSTDKSVDGKYMMTYLSLCRECYCEALTKGFDPWTKDKIPQLFTKARHCICAHDHREGHDEFLTKAKCKDSVQLSRREIVFSRFFKDNACRKEIW